MKRIIRIMVLFAAVLLLSAFCREVSASADDALEVSIEAIDYEKLTMRIYKHGNGIIYYSADKKNWNEIESNSSNSGTVFDNNVWQDYLDMDISFANATANVKLYIKGDRNQSVVTVTLPRQSTSFKVKFNATDGDFTFTGQDDATYFYYRKNTDYNWVKVSFTDAVSTGEMKYTDFLKVVEQLRFKGARLIFRTGQTPGTNENNVGERPGKEVTVSITKFAAAPSVKLNINKLNFSTRNVMEYRLETATGFTEWRSCEASMPLEDIAPQVLADAAGNATSATVQFRTAATEKKAASQIAVVVIPAQGAAPTIGGDTDDVTLYIQNKYLYMTFNKATTALQYEYCIIDVTRKTFDINKTSWRAVKSNKQVKIAARTIPSGSEIYVRVKGVTENVNKGIALKLPSAYKKYIVP